MPSQAPASSVRAPGPARRASPLERPFLPAALALLSLAALLLDAPLLAVVRDLRLPDTDDAMRLVQVLDLLHGQSWFDGVQHRLGGPGGTPMHWSRIVDLPLAAGIVALAPFLGERLAAGLASAFWPLILLAICLAGLWWAGARWFGRRPAWLAVLAASQMTTIGLFAPGRIDHHNLQVVAMLGVLLALCDRARSARGAALRGLAAGCLSAASLAIGLEALPFVAFCGAAACCAWIAGRLPWEELRFGSFGAALALAAPLLFAAETRPGDWLVPHCDALSVPWLALASGGGAAAVLLAGSSRRLRSMRARLGAAALAAAATVLPVLAVASRCLASPLGDLPEIVRREWLGKVAEALSLPATLAYSPEMVLGGMLPLALGAAFALARARRAGSGDEAHRILVLGGFLAVGLAISVVQLRGIYVASAALPLVAGAALDRALRLVGAGGQPLKTAAALALALGMLGKVAALPLLAAQKLAGSAPAAAITREVSNCAEETSVAALNRLAPGTILAPVDLGPAILLFTHHRAVAAPYHRAAAGLAASLRAVAGTEEELAREIERSGAGILALCRAWTEGQPESFARSLANGAAVPWLEPAVRGPGDLVAWRVIRRP